MEISSGSANMKKSYTKADDELYARLVTRRISSVFTKLVLITPLSANQITLFDIFLGLLAAVLFACSNYYLSIIAALVLQLWYVFDCVDGEVARAKNQASLGGVFLDYIGHDLVQPMVFLGLGFGIINSNDQLFGLSMKGNLWMLFLSFLAAFFTQLLYNPRSNIIRTAISLVSGKGGTVEINLIKQDQSMSVGTTKESKTLFSRLKQIYRKIGSVFTYPFIMNLLLIVAIINLLPYMIAFYGITLPILWVLSVYSGFKYNYRNDKKLFFYHE